MSAQKEDLNKDLEDRNANQGKVFIHRQSFIKYEYTDSLKFSQMVFPQEKHS